VIAHCTTTPLPEETQVQTGNAFPLQEFCVDPRTCCVENSPAVVRFTGMLLRVREERILLRRDPLCVQSHVAEKLTPLGPDTRTARTALTTLHVVLQPSMQLRHREIAPLRGT
jgi:hypothetical protein